jgi:hypothetical protein
MSIDQASSFLVGSLLTGLGFIVITVAIVIMNNIIHKYWKSFGWKFFPAYFHETVDYVEPTLNKEKTK